MQTSRELEEKLNEVKQRRLGKFLKVNLKDLKDNSRGLKTLLSDMACFVGLQGVSKGKDCHPFLLHLHKSKGLVCVSIIKLIALFSF